MKFVHIADAHFDMPFTVLNANKMSEERRLDQRKTFDKVIEYIEKENIEYLFIAGDLYENEYVRKSTIDYINNSFKRIPNTKVYITPGNHDPYINNSYYNRYEWNENVHIFTKIDCIKQENIDIYGVGFTDFYSKEISLPKGLDRTKINILIMHADVNGNSGVEEAYNPILESKLKESDFNYIALGHIHKTNYDEGKNIIYPGSLISGGFDELGKHGMIVGDINEATREISLKFVELDSKEFVELEFDISNIQSVEELIESINKIDVESSKFYKIILIGNRNFEIKANEILKYINNDNIIKLKDMTKIGYNLEQISKEQTLRGIFVKELLSQINEENKNEILDSIYIGLELL